MTPCSDMGGEGVRKVADTAKLKALRAVVHAWIREDLPLSMKMMMMPKHVDQLVERVGRAQLDADIERRRKP